MNCTVCSTACLPCHCYQLFYLSHSPSVQMIPQLKTDLWSYYCPRCCNAGTSLALRWCSGLRCPWPWWLPAEICCCGRRGRPVKARTRLWGLACCGSTRPVCIGHTSDAGSLGPRWCKPGRSRWNRTLHHSPAITTIFHEMEVKKALHLMYYSFSEAEYHQTTPCAIAVILLSSLHCLIISNKKLNALSLGDKSSCEFSRSYECQFVSIVGCTHLMTHSEIAHIQGLKLERRIIAGCGPDLNN